MDFRGRTEGRGKMTARVGFDGGFRYHGQAYDRMRKEGFGLYRVAPRIKALNVYSSRVSSDTRIFIFSEDF